MSSDILQHNLVPKHEILTKKESKKVLEDLKITADKLPKILPTDPVVKAINAKEGDILKITRNSETAGIFVSYRSVRN